MLNKNKVFIAIILVFGILILGFLMLGWQFYRKNLSGILPAIKKPTVDVVEVTTSSTSPFALPPGFGLSIFASGLGNPRVMVFDNGGTMLVSLASGGKVVALPDKNNDGKADGVITILSGLNKPHGLALDCPAGGSCKLYVAETDALVSYDYDSSNFLATNRKKLLDLPKGGNHTTRSLQLISQDGQPQLLISVGSSCNVCREPDERRGAVLAYDISTGKNGLYAWGLRNAVYMTTEPRSGRIFVTEMGRDLLGDDFPPDEINILEAGKNYGWPICYGKNMHDGDFDKNTYFRNPCMEPFETPSLIDIPAHSAPLGLSFIPSEGWPTEFRNNLIVAYHGSWNRSVPTGYKVARMIFDENGNYLKTEDFITGFLNGNQKLGRPAGVAALPGGIIYITDDSAGVIYRLKYR
ncbi:MAG: PQQ-dependent sugar dehydrogenase [Patescibacteria group bacterium]